MSVIHEIIDRIHKNCLKNNCDSTGIINIEFNKCLEKNVDYIQLSPTDVDKFNKKSDYGSNGLIEIQ